MHCSKYYSKGTEGAWLGLELLWFPQIVNMVIQQGNAAYKLLTHYLLHVKVSSSTARTFWTFFKRLAFLRLNIYVGEKWPLIYRIILVLGNTLALILSRQAREPDKFPFSTFLTYHHRI